MAAALNIKTGVGSATRLPPRASVSDEGGMMDRRRWTSFLTWAFVLAEMAGRDGLLPTAAHAGADDLGRLSQAASETAPLVNSLPNISVSTATEGPEPITYQHAPTMPAYAPTALSSGLGEAKIAPAADVLAHSQGAAGGGGGGYGSSADGMHAGEPSVEAGTHISLGEVQFGAFNLAGEALDLGLHIDLGDAAHTLLGGLADHLGNLPLIGDPSGAHASDVGSPGQLNFADSSSPAASHELATPSGGYTNYGIALNLGASDIAHGSAEAAVHADALNVSALDSLPTDNLPGGDLNLPSDALHLDQSLLRTASDILA